MQTLQPSSFEEFCTSISHCDDENSRSNKITAYSSTVVDSQRIKTGKLHFVTDSGIVPCFLKAESTMLRGRLNIFNGESMNVMISHFHLGSGGNLVVTVLEEKLALEDGTSNCFLICTNHEEAAEWAHFLCSSAFANPPVIKSVRIPSAAKPSESSPNTRVRTIASSKLLPPNTIRGKLSQHIDQHQIQSAEQNLMNISAEQQFYRDRNMSNIKLANRDTYEDLIHSFNEKKLECETITKKITAEHEMKDDIQKKLTASTARAQNLMEEKFTVLSYLHLKQEEVLAKKFETKLRLLGSSEEFQLLGDAEQKEYLRTLQQIQDSQLSDFRAQCHVEDEQLFAKVQIEIGEEEKEIERLSDLMAASELRLEALDQIKRKADQAAMQLRMAAKAAKESKPMGSTGKIETTIERSMFTPAAPAGSPRAIRARGSPGKSKQRDKSEFPSQRTQDASITVKLSNNPQSQSHMFSQPSPSRGTMTAMSVTSPNEFLVESKPEASLAAEGGEETLKADPKARAEAIFKAAAPDLWHQQQTLKDKQSTSQAEDPQHQQMKHPQSQATSNLDGNYESSPPKLPNGKAKLPVAKTTGLSGTKQHQKNVNDIIEFSYRVFLLQQRSCAGRIQRAWRRRQRIRQLVEQERQRAKELKRKAKAAAAQRKRAERMLVEFRAAITIQCMMRRRMAKKVLKTKIKEEIAAIEKRAGDLRLSCILRWVAMYRLRQRKKEADAEAAIKLLLQKALKKRKKRMQAVSTRAELMSRRPLVPAVPVELKPVQKVPFVHGGPAPKNITDRLLETAKREIAERKSLGALAPIAKSLKKTSKTVGRMLGSALMIEQPHESPHRRAIDGTSLREQELQHDHSRVSHASFSEESIRNQQLRRVAVEKFVTLQQRDLAVAAALRR